MKGKTATRRAMLLSLTALLICAAMLVGTTFAWFTDSVTSGTNRIIAGNLDVELEHKSSGASAWTKVETTTEDLFQMPFGNTNTLWEPGAMAVESFRVKNVGSLALKYQFSLNPLTAEQYNSVQRGTALYDLRGVIKVAVTETAPADRAAAATLSYSDWNSFTASAAKISALEPGASQEFTVVFYWEPNDNDIDNLYNLKNQTADGWTLVNPTSGPLQTATQLSLLAGVTLLATQQTSESDSFDNQYDASADVGSAFANVTVGSATATGNVTTNTTGTTPSSTATLSSGITPAGTGITVVQLTATGDSANNALGVTETTVSGDTTTTVSNTANLVTETKDPGETAYTVLGDEVPAAVIDLTLTVVTTTTVETTGSDPVTTETSKTVSNGFTALVKTYVEPGMGTVRVVYPASSDSSVAFSTTYVSTQVATEAEVNEVGKYFYDATTGYLVFMTDHFSDYVVTTNAVAKNLTSGAYYETLQAAFDDVTSGSTILVLKNISTTENATFPEGKTATLDLNGKTIDGAVDKTEKGVIYNIGDLTITGNGTINSTLDNGASAIRNEGTLNILNGNYNGAPRVPDSWPAYCINNYGTMHMKDAVCTSIHGTICTYGEEAYSELENVTATLAPDGQATALTSHVIYTYANGTALIKSGTYTNNAADATSTGGTVVCNYNSVKAATIEISGGTFLKGCGLSEFDKGDIVVTGGTFDRNPTAYVAEGYVSTNDGGVWTVAEYSPEVIITKTGEPDQGMSLAQFRDSVNDGNSYAGYTVTVQKNIDMSAENWTPIGIRGTANVFKGTFDGQGHEITISFVGTSADRYISLFGQTKSATVRNFTVKGSISGPDDCSGAIGQMDGGTLEYVTNKVAVSSSGKAAGLVALSQVNVADGCYATISHCTNEGTITTTSSENHHSAGIVAQVNRGTIVTYCTNTGNIFHNGEFDKARNAGLAGIAGWSSNLPSGRTETVIIEHCADNGTLTIGAVNATGIVKKHILGYTTIPAYVTITDCTPAEA